MTRPTKTPELVTASVEGLQQSIKHLNYKTLTPRLKRLLRALLDSPSGLAREECDRATPCSNSPEYIRQLRERHGLEIPCELVSFTNVDGEPSRRGVYRLTWADVDRIRDAMKEAV